MKNQQALRVGFVVAIVGIIVGVVASQWLAYPRSLFVGGIELMLFCIGMMVYARRREMAFAKGSAFGMIGACLVIIAMLSVMLFA
jgi:hypothetical protein